LILPKQVGFQVEATREDVQSRYYGEVMRKVFPTKTEAEAWARETIKRFCAEIPWFKFRSVVKEIRRQGVFSIEYEVVILARI
jgi:hypothetical protein